MLTLLREKLQDTKLRVQTKSNCLTTIWLRKRDWKECHCAFLLPIPSLLSTLRIRILRPGGCTGCWEPATTVPMWPAGVPEGAEWRSSWPCTRRVMSQKTSGAWVEREVSTVALTHAYRAMEPAQWQALRARGGQTWSPYFPSIMEHMGGRDGLCLKRSGKASRRKWHLDLEAVWGHVASRTSLLNFQGSHMLALRHSHN